MEGIHANNAQIDTISLTHKAIYQRGLTYTVYPPESITFAHLLRDTESRSSFKKVRRSIKRATDMNSHDLIKRPGLKKVKETPKLLGAKTVQNLLEFPVIQENISESIKCS